MAVNTGAGAAATTAATAWTTTTGGSSTRIARPGAAPGGTTHVATRPVAGERTWNRSPGRSPGSRARTRSPRAAELALADAKERTRRAPQAAPGRLPT